VLNLHFYPKLFAYQSGSVIGRFVKNSPEIDQKRFFIYGVDLHFYAIDFYSGVRAGDFNTFEELKKEAEKGKLWVYTDEKGMGEIRQSNFLSYKILKETPRFHVSTLNPKFLNPETRAEECVPVYLVEVSQRNN
jgi:hypothetical protein